MDRDDARLAILAALNAQEYLNDYETSQFPVKEQQVYPIPFVTDAQTPLPAHQAEITTQFHQKGLQMAD